MAMVVCFEVAAPNHMGPNGNDNDSQITSLIMIVILSLSFMVHDFIFHGCSMFSSRSWKKKGI